MDDSGRVNEAIKEAQQRGIIFDVGHGVGSFTFDVAYKALSQGFYPGNISSDLHFYSIQGPVPDFLNVLTKFLYLGMSLDEVVRLSTETAVQTMGLDGKLGTLEIGAEGDATVMRLEEGQFVLTDSMGVSVESGKRLAHLCTIRGGHVYRPWLGALQTAEPTQNVSWRQILQ
jgi:dihydroorotase